MVGKTLRQANDENQNPAQSPATNRQPGGVTKTPPGFYRFHTLIYYFFSLSFTN